MNVTEKERWRRYGPEIRLILWAVWDPIGSGVPVDEYDAYAPQVWTLLRSGASSETIAAHLQSVREENIEMGSPQQDIQAAWKLCKWWRWRFEEE